MIVDTSALLAYFARNHDEHWAVSGAIELSAGEELIVSPFSIAELESIVTTEFGCEGWLEVLDELAGGAWTIAGVNAEHLSMVRESVALGAPVAAASVQVLADEHNSEILSARGGG